MKSEEYAERMLNVGAWPVRVSSYRIGERWHAKADNVSPGAWFARTVGDTRAEAEERAIDKARGRLERTRRMPV